MFGAFLLFAAVILLSYAFYRWARLNDDYFERRNIKYIKPTFLLGNAGDLLSTKYTAIEYGQKLYNAFPNEPIFGAFFFRSPQYIVCDPEAVKLITVKAFDHFEDHRGFGEGADHDKIWANSLFMTRGEKWRSLRATISPAFTGSKMRHMFELVVECADDVAKHFLERSKNESKISIEMKDVGSRYGNDVILTCAFGLKVDSFLNPNNEFFTNGKKITDFTSLKRIINTIIIMLFPKIAKAFNVTFSDQTETAIFRNAILNTVKVRQENNIYRPDMINMLIQIRDGTLKHQTDEKPIENEGFATVQESLVGKSKVARTWNDDEIVAQCFGFFIGGFDTTSTILSFTANVLMTHPNIQQQLYEEIVQTNAQFGARRLTYDALQKMKYMDQVISEVLRKWPPIAQLDRICVKDYELELGNAFKLKAKKGDFFQLNVYGLHHDEKYFKNPDKFEPERFSDENKQNILPGTYLPFGIGPRNCVGSRFALMEIKAILYYLILNFSFEPNEKSEIPLKLKPGSTMTIPGSVYLDLVPRHKQ